MKKNKKYLFLIFIISFFFYLIMFLRKCYYGYDFYYHYYQILDYLERIDCNPFFLSPISSTLANSFGYGASFFYPPFFHLITAYFVKITSCNIIVGMNFILFLGYFCSGITMYFLSIKLFHNERVAFFSSILYMFFPYHVADIFIRSSFSESFSFIFFPVIINGILELRDDNYAKFYRLFVLGYFFAIQSHYLSTIYFTILIIPFFLYYRKKVFCRKKIVALLIASFFILMMSLPLITSVLQHKILGNYRVFNANVMFSNSSFNHSIVPLSDYFFFLDNGFKGGTAVFISYEIWFLLLYLFFNIKKIDMELKNTQTILLITAIITGIFLSSKILWFFLPDFVKVIQFTWRMLIMLSIPLSLLAASSLLLMHQKFQKIIIGCCIITLISVGFGIGSNSSEWEMNFSEEVKEKYSLGYQKEYFPFALTNDYYQNRSQDILQLDKKADIEVLENDTPYLKFKIENLHENITLELPRIYYLGYQLNDENGKSIMLEESENGFLQATVDKNSIYILQYKGTKLWNTSKILSLFSLLFFLFWQFKKEKIESRVYDMALL